MKTRIAHLRVKIKCLATEATNIRIEEHRALARPKPGVNRRRPADLHLYQSLHEHRVGIVRSAAREALLAYAMIRGTPYRMVERDPATTPDWKKIRAIAERFGACQDWSAEPMRGADGDAAWKARSQAQTVAFDAWIEEAKKPVAKAVEVAA